MLGSIVQNDALDMSAVDRDVDPLLVANPFEPPPFTVVLGYI
jgi:hypothetical protein